MPGTGYNGMDDAKRIRRKLGPFFRDGAGEGGGGLWRGVRADWGRAKRVVDIWELVGGTELRADDDDSDVTSAVVEVDALTEAMFVRGGCCSRFVGRCVFKKKRKNQQQYGRKSINIKT